MSTPRICPCCNNYMFDDEAPKCVCENNLVPKSARPVESGSLCSDLVGDITAANKEIARLRRAIQETLTDNRHLADGDNCTLIKLKRAMSPTGEVSDSAATGAPKS